MVSHGEGILAGKINEVKAYKHQGAWRRLTAVRVVEEARWRRLSTVMAFGTAWKFIGSSEECRRGSVNGQNGLVIGRRSSRREEMANGGAVFTNWVRRREWPGRLYFGVFGSCSNGTGR